MKSLLLAIMLIILMPSIVSAEELVIRPFLIDESILPRDILTRDITLTNTYQNRKLLVYATVNEITMDDEGEIKEFQSPVMTDRTNTVTSWVEISRGRIEIEPGESVTVPVTVRTHPNAEAGVYHVFLGFYPTNKRFIAEEAAMNGDADGVILKITVTDDRSETLRLNRFSVDRFVFNGEEQGATIELQNLGELPTTPAGEIIFYDSNGSEIGAAMVNTEGVVIEPGEKVSLKTTLPIDDTLGRFKANMALTYGANQSASLYDTTTFYLMPPHLLLLVFGSVLGLAIFLVLALHRAYGNRFEEEDDDVALYYREGHNADPQDHDIDLKKQD